MATLLQYSLATDFNPTTTLSGVVGSEITNASLSYFARDSGLAYATEPVGVSNPPTATTSAALAITNNSYFTVTITPTSGNTISLTTLTFNMARGGASTVRGYDVRSSVDTYAATLGTANIATTRPTFTAVSIDLSGASFQTISTAITFRVYLFAPSASNSLDWDTLTISGTVASSGTVEQEGFRFRADDGSETGATYLASQDVDVIRQINTSTRLRVLLNSTLNRGSEQYRLEYRKVGDSTWTYLS